ncbi:MAG: DUF4272 domain-containing protein [Myxococcota bacterium]
MTDTSPDQLEVAAPEADAVAARALMVAALLERAKLESSRDAARAEALVKWVEREDLLAHLGDEGEAVFSAAPGSWSDDAAEAVAWTAEELQLLLWALRRAELPTAERAANAGELLADVPVLGDVADFVENAALRPPEEVDALRALYAVLHEAVRAEVYARAIVEDPLSLEGDEAFEELLSTVAAEGFDRAQAAAQGKAHEAIEGLRFWSRSLLGELPAEAGVKLDAPRLVALQDEVLATLLGVTHARVEALAWLLEGDGEDR